MLSMPQGAYAYTMTICSVHFEISPDDIAQLQGLPHVLQTSSTEPAEVERAYDVGTYTSSTSPIDSQAKGDHSDNDDQSGNVHHDKNFFILTRRHYMELDTKNTFSQKLLRSFLHVASHYCNKFGFYGT